MRGWPLLLAALLAAGCAARRAPDTAATAPGPRTLLDGVYSAAQSRRGEMIYFSTCVKCHRPEMTGSQIVPPLIGQPFLGRWGRKTAGDLFEWVRVSMPPGEDAKLSPQEYADVLAYVFRRNEFPAGPDEMAADFAALRTIRIAPETPGADVSAGPSAQR